VRRVRIHTAQPLSVDAVISLEAAPAAHVARVLRLRPGDRLWLFNGDGHDCLAVIETLDRRRVSLRVLERRRVDNEPPLAVTLVQGVCKGERMDWVMQKAVELGVTRVVPVLSEHGVVRLSGERRERRRQHWRAVMIAACEQSGRAVVPELAPVCDFAAWLQGVGAATGETRVLLHPEGGGALAQLPPPRGGVCLAVGPEGGWSASECSRLQACGFSPVHLGPRVLRTETAALAALAAVQTLWGDWGAVPVG